MNDYVSDFKLLPTSIVFGFDDPNDQIAMLNKLITGCIADHASIRKVKFTRPPAPWMKDSELVTAKKHLEHLRNLKNACVKTHEYNLSGKENEPLNEPEILQLLNRVPDSNAFTINYTTYDEVQKIILNLRNDCSSDHDDILIKFLKPVVDQITSPIVLMIHLY